MHMLSKDQVTYLKEELGCYCIVWFVVIVKKKCMHIV